MERDVMIDYIKSQYLDLGEELCNDYIEDLSYYEEIESAFTQKSNSWFKNEAMINPFDVIPLCWQGPYSYDSSIDWLMIGGFTIENDILYVEIYNYHTGPPDYMTIGIDMVPDEVLIAVVTILQVMKKEREGERARARDLDFYIDETIKWLLELPHTKKETILFLLSKGLSECEVKQVLQHVEPLIPLY